MARLSPCELDIPHRFSCKEFGASIRTYRPDGQAAVHSHELGYISCVLAGGYAEFFGSRVIECGAGTVGIHQPGETHANRIFREGATELSVAVSPNWARTLASVGLLPGERIDLQGPTVTLSARAIAAELADPGCTAGSLARLLEEFFAVWKPAPREDGSKAGNRRWLAKVRERLADQPLDDVSLFDLAELACVDPCYLVRAFKSEFGETPMEFQRRRRIETALFLMRRTALPIGEIAQVSGFADSSHLRRWIVRTTGRSPKRVRAQA